MFTITLRELAPFMRSGERWGLGVGHPGPMIDPYLLGEVKTTQLRPPEPVEELNTLACSANIQHPTSNIQHPKAMSRKEEILVLYGSQTGNSEQAAIDLADRIPDKLSNDEVAVSARHMQLDDFLEIESAKWPRLVVIVTSSYGVGQAPLGCYKFRALCDAIGERKLSGMLEGVSYAMCGLGDSKYTTFFQNPSTINAALLTAGAWRAGLLGKADASGEGEDEQAKVIQRWVDTHWTKLARVLAEDPPAPEKLESAQKKTLELCEELFEDFTPPKKGMLGGPVMIVLPVLLALLGGAFLNGNLTFS